MHSPHHPGRTRRYRRCDSEATPNSTRRRCPTVGGPGPFWPAAAAWSACFFSSSSCSQGAGGRRADHPIPGAPRLRPVKGVRYRGRRQPEGRLPDRRRHQQRPGLLGGHPARLRRGQTVFYEGQTQTGCGLGTSDVGPFYCPTDQTVYIDLGFYDQLRSQFGAQGGPLRRGLVIGHEYGHHVENLRGCSAGPGATPPAPKARGCESSSRPTAWPACGPRGRSTPVSSRSSPNRTSPTASTPPAIGDDRIQEKVQGQVNPESFTHGSAEQRQRWFLTGYRSTAISGCDTFAAPPSDPGVWRGRWPVRTRYGPTHDHPDSPHPARPFGGFGYGGGRYRSGGIGLGGSSS